MTTSRSAAEQGRRVRHGVVWAVMAIAMASAQAQTQTDEGRAQVPDAQVESNVLRALARVPGLTNQKVNSVTVYGVVTLSGTVQDEATRSAVETAVSRTAGVTKVIDELTIPGEPAAASAAASAPVAGAAGSDVQDGRLATAAGEGRRVLLSDGTTAPEGSQAESPAGVNQVSPVGGESAGQTSADIPGEGQNGAQQSPVERPYNGSQAGPLSTYPNPQQPRPNAAEQPGHGPGQPPYGNGQPGYGPGQPGYGSGQPGYSGAYTPQEQPGYAGQRSVGRGQIGGQPVVVPSGSVLRVRTNQGFDSKNTQPGTPFDAVVLNDVVANGAVAIPRGASVQGVVAESHRAGALKGRGELSLTLTSVTLAGRQYPISTDGWSNFGADKTGRTVGSAIGLGALGAVIGAVAGGGPGAAVGAGLGGAAGVGTSAASGGGQAMVPAEAILIFHLTQPVPLTTVSQAEMDRLSYGVAPARRMLGRTAPGGYGPGGPPPPPPPSPYTRY